MEQGDGARETLIQQPGAIPAQNASRNEDKFWNGILAVLVIVLILLVGNDVIRQARVSNQIYWDNQYIQAVQHDSSHWRIGWRLEDIAQKLSMQRSWLGKLKEGTAGHNVRAEQADPFGPNPAATTAARLTKALEDVSHMYKIECAARPAKYLQVGLHALRSTPDDCCSIHASAEDPVGPHSLFERVDLSAGTFGLRSMATGRFVSLVPPGWGDGGVWTTELGTPMPGLAEQLRMKEGKVWSDVMKGYLQCQAGMGTSAPVTGRAGLLLWDDEKTFRFNFVQASQVEVQQGLLLREISRQVAHTQQIALAEHRAVHPPSPRTISQGKIALCVPMTSAGTAMRSIEDSPFWPNLFSSFMGSVHWKDNRFTFSFYLGFDVGDKLYDTGDAWSDFRQSFQSHIKKAAMNLDLGPAVLNVVRRSLSVKLMHFDLKGAPSQVVAQLARQAYKDGADYIYQINDDSIIETPDWALSFASVLYNNPVHQNLGVTGPTDTNNQRILTHAFVHRNHLDIFGSFFPASFKNWWSDDWISTVYGELHTFRDHYITVRHNVETQKLGEVQRYRVDNEAQYHLEDELKAGHMKLLKWTLDHNILPAPLPVVCGYIPLVADLYSYLMKGTKGKESLPGRGGALGVAAEKSLPKPRGRQPPPKQKLPHQSDSSSFGANVVPGQGKPAGKGFMVAGGQDESLGFVQM